jgi:ubiquinone/menaquinone biosynthesis C-methylase UbiE
MKLLLLLALLLSSASPASAQGASTIPTAKVFEAIAVREGITVCEIGAGNGDLTLEAAKLVGPKGARVHQ